jgi:tetratricopeptide (TPR) repeat protein
MSLAQVGGIELTRQAVHLIETGKVRPSMRSLRVLAHRLHVPVTAFLVTPDSRGPFDQDAIADLERLCRHRQYDQALTRGREIVEWARSPELLATARKAVGEALCYLDRPGEALENLRRGRELFEAMDDDGGRAAETMELEALALQIAEDPQALVVAQEALRRYRALDAGRPEVESRILQRIGTVLAARGEFGPARAQYEEALLVAGGVRDLGRLARLYHGLAVCEHGVGDVRSAADLMFKAHTLYEAEERLAENGAGSDLARVENDIAIQLIRQGDLARGEAFVESSMRRFERAGLERMRSHVLLTLAELRQRQGRPEEGVEYIQRAIDFAQRFDETQALGAGHRQLGELLTVCGKHVQAAASFERALATLQAAGLQQAYADCLAARDRALGGHGASEATGSSA